MKKKIVYLCMLSLLSMLLLAGCKSKEEKNNPNYNSDNYLSGKHYAVIDVQDYGEIYLVMYADIAPATVTNFVNLATSGFYDGLTFHRVMNGFMIQGGDPKADGSGNSEYTIPGEFIKNGFNNTVSHTRGTISMARTEDYDSASCQFFIMHEEFLELDEYYAAFGKVLSGMNVVDAICTAVPVEDNNGTVLPENQPVITSIRIIDEKDVVYEDDKQETTVSPSASAVITLHQLKDTEDLPLHASLKVHADASVYYFSSTEELKSIGIYQIDLEKNGLKYEKDDLLAYTTDVPANYFLSLIADIVPNKLNLLLVAEETDGAVGKYIIDYDLHTETAYLIPVY